VDGIFFDEMASRFTNPTTKIDYYQNLTKYAKATGFSRTVGNPGQDTTAELARTVDTSFIYETEKFPSESTLQSRTTALGLNNVNKFGVIPYGVPTLRTAAVKMARKYVGYIYVTERSLRSNPWGGVCKYIKALFKALA